MRKMYMLALAICLIMASQGFSQITISGSTGTANGTYTSLTNAAGAFAALNTAGSHNAGDVISISITADVITEAGANSLNAGTWASVTVNPSGARTISGAPAAGTALINLNGADNITVDGLNSGGNSLTISNTTVSATANTSTLRFINDATGNTITRCTILGSTTATAAQTGTASSPSAATILFGGASSSTGNDNNSITACTIAEAGANLPAVAISSAGQSTSISNDNITISSNNIANFYASGGANGICVGSNSSAFTISNNRFYQTASRSGLASGNYLECIFISTASGGGYVISGNTIGFNSAAGTGMFTNSGGRFVGIDLTAVAASPVSDIQGNVITNINWTTGSGAASLGGGVFNAIIVKAGGVNIGTTSGNTIGATSGTASASSNIFVTSTATGSGIIGIYVTSATATTISNNTVAAIATSGTAAIGFAFTGIAVAGSGNHSITSNTIGNSTAGSIAIGTSGTTTAITTFTGIISSATGTTATLGNTAGTGNTVQNAGVFGANGSSGFTGIQNAGAAGTVNMNYNTISNISFAGTGSTAGTVYFSALTNSGAATTALNVNNNSASACDLTASTFGGTAIFIFSSASAAASAVSFQNNSVTGFTYSGSTGGTSSFYGIYHSATSASLNVSTNNFNNLTLKTSGGVILCNLNNATTNVTVSGNFITTQLNRTVSSGNSLIGIYSIGGAGVSSGTHLISNNNLSNITSITTAIATTGVVGILWEPGTSASSAPAVTISGNTTGNYVNSSTSPVTGIWGDWSSNLRISGNTVNDLSGGGAVSGIQCNVLGTTSNIFRNKVYGLSTSGATSVTTGLNIVSSGSSLTTTTLNAYNNFVGNLLASSSSGNNQVIGISVTGPNSTNTYNLYYNTIYLNASGGANFGSSAVSVSTTPTVAMRNNILTNLSTPSGTGLTVAYRRSSTTLTTYGAASNNNDFFAGTPGASRLIYYDGTNADQTLAAYKTRVSTRDAVSISENPVFTSTTGSNAQFLHIDPAVGTQIESGGANIATYTDDYDADIRQGNGGYTGTGTAPDIGADEFEGTPAPSMTYVSSTTTQNNVSTVLTNTINQEVIGIRVVTTGILNPLSITNFTVNTNGSTNTADISNARLFYTGTNPAYAATNQFGSTVANPSGSFVINGTQALQTGTNYFWLAYDIPCAAAAGDVIDAECTSLTVGSAQTPTVTDPGSGRTLVTGPMSGNYTIGTGGNYPNLGAAVSVLNTAGMSGNTTFTVLDNITEAGVVTINPWAECGAGNYSLLIKPNTGATVTVSGAVNGGALIRMLAKNITIDGSNNGTSSRDMTITNTSTTTPSVILIGSTGVVPITNVAVRNCIIINGASTSTALYVSDAATAGNAGYFNNITIQNNSIQRAYMGIFGIATVATGNGNNLNISGNDLNTSGANAIRLTGIYVQGVDGAMISNNNVGNINNANAENPRGIWVASGSNNTTVSGNTVNNISLTNTGAFAPAGIFISAGAAVTAMSVTGNTVSNLSCSGTLASFGGIVTITPNTNVTNNNISNLTQLGATVFWGIVAVDGVNANISGNTVSGLTTATTGVPNGINIQGVSTGLNIFNNRVSNIKNTNTGGYTSNGISLSSSSTTANISVRNNFIWDIAGYGWTSLTTDNGYGISINSGGGYKLYYNTVSMGTNQTLNTSNPACLFISSSVTTAASVDVRNNIFSHTATVGANRFAVLCNATNTIFSAMDYNDYYSSGSNLGYIGSNRSNLAAMQTGFGGNTNSLNVLPNFVSASDLHLVTNSNCGLDGKATPIAGITVDIDNDTRNVTTPDIGADEFTGNFSLVITDPAAACGSVDITAATVTAGSSTGTTLSYWMDLAATTAIPAGNGTPSAITTSGVYYIKSVKGSCSDVKAVNVTVNARPTGVISGTTTICAGSTATLTLTVTGSGTVSGTLSDGSSYSGTAPTITVTVSPVSSTTYTISTMNDANCAAVAGGLTGSAGVTVTAASGNLAAVTGGSQVCSNGTVMPVTGSTYSDPANCDVIARIVPSGASPVSGAINTCVKIDNSVQSYGAEPYVQRHYDVEPATNPSTSTARITLYFADNEFVTYNANSTGFKPLPTATLGNADPAIANLRVNQFHGTGTLPGNYTGAQEVINPNDADIVWNAGASRWEITVDVNGFSGFYITSVVDAPLPITISYFKGARQNGTHLLSWKVNCTNSPYAKLTLERSAAATGGFSQVYYIQATAARCNDAFNHTDLQPLPGMNYYRLKMVDADGKTTYSGIVALLNASKGFDIVSIAPNPVVNGTFKLNVTTAQAAKMDIVIIDMEGRVVQRRQEVLQAGFNPIDMNVAGLSSGTYSLYGVTADGRSSVHRFVKQ